MAATVDQIAQLRRSIAEPTTANFPDAELASAIERYPLIDVNGQPPFIHSTTVPITLIPNIWWAATYDINSAAADLWSIKAAMLAGNYDFSADGGNYSRSQAYEQAMKQARYYRSRRSITTFEMRPEPTDLSDLAYGNELDDD